MSNDLFDPDTTRDEQRREIASQSSLPRRLLSCLNAMVVLVGSCLIAIWMVQALTGMILSLLKPLLYPFLPGVGQW